MESIIELVRKTADEITQEWDKLQNERKLIAPVRNSIITSDYGNRILNGEKQFHHGIDYVSKTKGNNLVRAITNGICIFAHKNYNEKNRWNMSSPDSLGRFIYLSHKIDDQIYYVLYAHLEKIIVSVGESVGNGDVIGNYGNTGYSYGAHLHLEAYKQKWEKANIKDIMIEGGAYNES